MKPLMFGVLVLNAFHIVVGMFGLPPDTPPSFSLLVAGLLGAGGAAVFLLLDD